MKQSSATKALDREGTTKSLWWHSRRYFDKLTPKRGASNALAKATEHINAGYQWIIDLDLKSFFDKINHDKLMSIIERKISDKVLLKLIRNYLQSMRGVKN